MIKKQVNTENYTSPPWVGIRAINFCFTMPWTKSILLMDLLILLEIEKAPCSLDLIDR